MMVDANKRPLRIPSRFASYLEKYKIYELFYELTRDLALRKPEDHILFLKQELNYKGLQYVNASRVILFAPPGIDKMELSKLMGEATGALPVSLTDIVASDSKGHLLRNTPEEMAWSAARVLKSCLYCRLGWILYDFPRDRSEAVALQRTGILPTHVIALIPSKQHDDNVSDTLDPCDERFGIKEYCRLLLSVREVYHTVLKECKIKGRSIRELADDCSRVIRIMPQRAAPFLQHIVIIGSRGSGAKTQAKILSERFGIVQLDLETMLRRAKIRKNILGEELRNLQKFGLEVPPATVANVVQDCLQELDNSYKGWVLTGYPRNADEMKHLDTLGTSPNRVIFLNVPPDVCINRLIHRRVDHVTGLVYNLSSYHPDTKTMCHLVTHPRDYIYRVQAQINDYNDGVNGMKVYCGETATYINGDLPMLQVTEMVQAAVIRPSPPVPPRQPRPVLEILGEIPETEIYISGQIRHMSNLSSPFHQPILRDEKTESCISRQNRRMSNLSSPFHQPLLRDEEIEICISGQNQRMSNLSSPFHQLILRDEETESCTSGQNRHMSNLSSPFNQLILRDEETESFTSGQNRCMSNLSNPFNQPILRDEETESCTSGQN